MCISLNSENRAFPQYGKLACALTDKIAAAWRWSSNPGINHKALLLLYPVAARAANLHSGTPGPIDRSAAAHPLPPTPARVQKVKFLPRPEGGGGGGVPRLEGQGGSAAEEARVDSRAAAYPAYRHLRKTASSLFSNPPLIILPQKFCIFF